MLSCKNLRRCATHLEPRRQPTSNSDGQSQNKPFAPPFIRARDSGGSGWACGERPHEAERRVIFARLFGVWMCEGDGVSE